MPQPTDSSRSLLFGLLALQNGLIDQAALFAAFAAWTRDKGRTLADHLVELGHLDGPRRAAVEAIAAVHVQTLGGDPGKSLAVLAVGRATRESLARVGGPEFEATIGHVSSAQPSTRDDLDPERTGTCSVGSATSDGLRFRIVRPHARGGLGAVFVALDSELNREVALKQILDDRADDPANRYRFLIEAEITGGLEHPGIVPVYGLGFYGDGRPYYAMRFIRGDSLKEAIDRFHRRENTKLHSSQVGQSHREGATRAYAGSRDLALRKLLRRFMDVCNAIDYAHSRGVIHRDLKPANIIVGAHGETLVVDWGLAKPMGRALPETESGERLLIPSSASGSSETLPGSALGTPAYMSPEQAEGQLERLGPRSDVYSLGATLYCLLTGQPPFAGDVVKAIRSVQRGEFRPPRQLDASIDPALEAICLQAMAHRPDDRYPSCRALAEDLDRWMADEPVTAWREPPARRARRWARRNRTAVTAVAVALVAGVFGLSAVLAVQTRAKADLAASLKRETSVNTALADSNAELTVSRAAVQARYDLAVEAIKTFHTGVSEDFLLKQEQFKDVRDRLLKSASDFYGRLGALLGKESNLASRRALWQTNYEVAGLTGTVGKPEDALAAHRQVLAARLALAAEPQAGTEIKADVGRSLMAVARLLGASGKTQEAEVTYRKAETLLVERGSMIAEAAAVRAALAECRTNLGWLLYNTGRNDEALSVYRLARADQEALAAVPGENAGSQHSLAFTINRVAILLATTGKSSEAESEYRKALALYQSLADGNSAGAHFRNVAGIQNNLGNLLSATGKSSEAETEYRNALAIQQKLADDNPAVTDFRESLALSRANLGVLLTKTGKTSAAEVEYRKALAIYQRLADDNPAVTEFRSLLAGCHHKLGWLQAQTGRTTDAETEYLKALALFQKLADDNPVVPGYKSGLALSHDAFGQLLRSTGKLLEAEAEYRKALAIRQILADGNPSVTEFLASLASSHNDLGLLLAATGKSAAAEAEYGAALALYLKLADDNPAVTDFPSNLAGAHNNLGMLLANSGKSPEAEAEYHKALTIQQKLAGDNPAMSKYRVFLANHHYNLGNLLAATGKSLEAETEFRKALAIQKKLADDNPAFTAFRSSLASSHNSLGNLLSKTGKASAAEAEHRKALAIQEKLADVNPKVPAYRNDVASAYTNNADAARALGRLAEASNGYERAIAIRESLVQEYPTTPLYRSHLAYSLRRRGLARLKLDDTAGAAADARRALALYESLPLRSGGEWFEFSCCYAALAGLAGRDGSGVSVDDGTSDAEQAMALLAKALSMNHRSLPIYRTESALDPFRSRPDLQLLMMDLAMPTEPFAR
jgi:serine/threonine protein kinase/tetratricopeptide (TPR) repeat protein